MTTITTVNPADGTTLATCPATTPAEIDRIVSSGAQAAATTTNPLS